MLLSNCSVKAFSTWSWSFSKNYVVSMISNQLGLCPAVDCEQYLFWSPLLEFRGDKAGEWDLRVAQAPALLTACSFADCIFRSLAFVFVPRNLKQKRDCSQSTPDVKIRYTVSEF